MSDKGRGTDPSAFTLGNLQQLAEQEGFNQTAGDETTPEMRKKGEQAAQQMAQALLVATHLLGGRDRANKLLKFEELSPERQLVAATLAVKIYDDLK